MMIDERHPGRITKYERDPDQTTAGTSRSASARQATRMSSMLVPSHAETGMLAREVLALERGDVDHATGVLRIRGRERERVVPLGRAFAWVARYERQGGPRTGKTLAAIVMRYVAQAGVAKRDGCDLLRRTAWAQLRARGLDVESVRVRLGMRTRSRDGGVMALDSQPQIHIHRAAHG